MASTHVRIDIEDKKLLQKICEARGFKEIEMLSLLLYNEMKHNDGIPEELKKGTEKKIRRMIIKSFNSQASDIHSLGMEAKSFCELCLNPLAKAEDIHAHFQSMGKLLCNMGFEEFKDFELLTLEKVKLAKRELQVENHSRKGFMQEVHNCPNLHPLCTKILTESKIIGYKLIEAKNEPRQIQNSDG